MTCDHQLDDCGCCEADRAAAKVDNTPGQRELHRRVGTVGSFTKEMAADLTRQPGLARLTNRRADDPTIALVDAWAAVLDILAFYDERLANEGYLRTAQEPASLNELAQSIGYLPGRGRASAAALSFTLEDAAGSPAVVPIGTGTKVASLPGPGETPQTYETTSDILARPAWNSMAARTRTQQELRAGALQAYVEGIRTDLTAGDAVLLLGREREASSGSEAWAFRVLSAVEHLPDLGATRLAWADPLGQPAAGSGRGTELVPDPRDARLYVLRRKAGIFGAAAPDYRILSTSLTWPSGTAGIVIPDAAKSPGPDWPGWTVVPPDQPENTVDLDGVEPKAVPASWAVLTRAGGTGCYRVISAAETSRTDYTLNAKVARLTLQGIKVSGLFRELVRETSAWVGSELLPLATTPIDLPVQGDLIDIAGEVPSLEPGRTVVVRGPRPVVRVVEGIRTLTLLRPGSAPVPLHPGDVLEVTGPVVTGSDGTRTWPTSGGSVTAAEPDLVRVAPRPDAPLLSEAATIAEPTTTTAPAGAPATEPTTTTAPASAPTTDTTGQLRLVAKLVGCYDRASVRILGNIAAATHGETRSQVLGSGDAAATYQRFSLAQKPLTYVAAGTGADLGSTLRVRVDGRLWTEVPRLFGRGPTEEVFITEMADDGKVSVLFGDGLTGARVPTGTNNLTATYRVGTGVAGRVGADRLTLPMSRPLGLRSVTNPMPTGLAADPEAPDAVRDHAPQTVMTLDRVVSLRDYENFALTTAGIGGALAAWLWDGHHRLVHLTVAGTDGQSVDPKAVSDLRDAIRSAGDPLLPLTVEAAEVVPVSITARVVVDPLYETAAVLDMASAALVTALAASSRAIAQPMTAGDVIMVAHRIPGVVALTVTSPAADIPSLPARVEGTAVKPAQLVALAPGGLSLNEAVS